MTVLQVELAEVTLYGLVALALVIAWFETGRRKRRTMCRNELDGEIEELKADRDKADERRDQQLKALDGEFEGDYEAEVEKIWAKYWKTYDFCTERIWCLETMRRMI